MDNKKNKKIKKNKKNKKKSKMNKIDSKVQTDILKKHFKINYIFYIVILICLYVLSKSPNNTKSFFCIILSFIIILIWGYSAHVISHQFNYTEIYDRNSILFKIITPLDFCLRKLFSIFDFHDTIHHDTEINKEYKNMLFEGINNFLIQGFIVVVVGTIYNYLDWRIFVFWGLMYASVHIINYSLIMPLAHKDHHKRKNTNYGIDLMDIIMGTKYDWNDLEDYNHYSINAIILTLLFKKFVY